MTAIPRCISYEEIFHIDSEVQSNCIVYKVLIFSLQIEPQDP